MPSLSWERRQAYHKITVTELRAEGPHGTLTHTTVQLPKSPGNDFETSCTSWTMTHEVTGTWERTVYNPTQNLAARSSLKQYMPMKPRVKVAECGYWQIALTDSPRCIQANRKKDKLDWESWSRHSPRGLRIKITTSSATTFSPA